MPWMAVACAAAGAIAAHEQQRQFDAVYQGLQPFCTSDKPADKSLEQLAREHRARMDATHAETMWHAKAVTFLLGALVLTIGLMVAGVI